MIEVATEFCFCFCFFPLSLCLRRMAFSSFGLVKSTEIRSLDNDLLYQWSDFSSEERYSSSCHLFSSIWSLVVFLSGFAVLLWRVKKKIKITTPNARLYCINCYIKHFLIAFQAPWLKYMEYWPCPKCWSAFPSKSVNSLSYVSQRSMILPMLWC